MISTALRVLLLLTFYILRTTQGGDSVCPPGASIDLSNAKRNASGFVSVTGHLFPEHKTRTIDGVRRGCVCDLKPCLAICPPKKADPEETFVIDYTAIPQVNAINGTLDDEANHVGPEKWFHILVWRPPCPGDNLMQQLVPEEDEYDEFHLLRNGSLFFPWLNEPDEEIRGFDNYCLGLVQNKTDYIPRVCYLGETEIPEFVEKVQYYGRLVTLPFIIATIIVYSVIPKLKNIHGTTLRCYLCCLTVTNVALPWDRIPDPDFEAGPWCLCLGFTIYFSVISGFLWLNVMCLDLWWRFGGCGSFRSTGMKKDRKKFIWYSIYVWGMSILITAICIGMEFAPNVAESIIRPGFASGACWFDSEEAITLYYTGPIGLIMSCNIALFIITTIKLARHKNQTQRDFNSRSSRRHNHKKQWFGLHLKLCIAMGVCWSTEVVAKVWEGPMYLYFVTGMINAIQGILIFIIFVCKKSIWISLKDKYGKKKLTASKGVGPESKLRRMTSQLSNSSQTTQDDTITQFSTTSR